MSTEIDHDHVASWYEHWRGSYLPSCNGGLMPTTENSGTSKVESVGFAMMIAAYMADKDTVDGLHTFYESKISECGLDAWQTSCSGIQDSGSATDGDVDVAAGLVVAHWQWPDDGYDAKVLAILEPLEEMITECDDLLAVIPGCGNWGTWGGCNETNASYYSPAFFRYFAHLSGNDIWMQLADDTHTIRDRAAHSNTGLVPDWQTTTGANYSGSRNRDYGFDAVRVAFKHALDFLFHGNEAAEAWCIRISNWANSVGVGSLKDQYYLDGGNKGGYHNMVSVGSIAVCSLANDQSVADAFVAESARMKNEGWYNDYLGVLFLLAMSGNMWAPDVIRQQD